MAIIWVKSIMEENIMKKLIYTLMVSLMAVVMLAACTSGGNVDDDDGKVSDTSSVASDDNQSGNTSSGGMMSDLVSDVESGLGIDGANSGNSGTTSNASK